MRYAVIAAGEGSRLSQEGVAVPKPLVEVGGERLIGRLLRIFMDCGATDICVVTNSQHPETSAYLEQCGWKVETPALKEETVLIPKSFSNVFETYNDLQKQQGFDLSRYAGCEVKLYTYKVLDSNLGDNVLASLYVSDGRVVGGDVHSTALDGFMCGLRQEKQG